MTATLLSFDDALPRGAGHSVPSTPGHDMTVAVAYPASALDVHRLSWSCSCGARGSEPLSDWIAAGAVPALSDQLHGLHPTRFE